MDAPNYKQFSFSSVKGAEPPKGQLSMAQLQELINQRKTETICVIAVLISLFAISQIAPGKLSAINEVTQQVKLLRDKEDLVRQYRKIQKDLKSFPDSVPMAVNENHFITLISGLAGKRQIEVVSFTPPQVENKVFYEKVYLKLDCIVEKFPDALLFLNEIEKSRFSLRVDSWSAQRGEIRATDGQPAKTLTNVTLSLSSLRLKEDDPKKDKNE